MDIIYTTQTKIAKAFRLSSLKLSIILNREGLKVGRHPARSAIQQKIAKKQKVLGRTVWLWNKNYLDRLLSELGYKQSKKIKNQIAAAHENYQKYNKVNKNTFVIFTDAAAQEHVAAWAYLIKHPDKSISEVSAIIKGNKVTNNLAELQAALEAIKKIPIDRKYKVILFSDSSYVVNGINKWIKLVAGELSKKHHKNLWFELRSLAKSINLTAYWVKSHNSFAENNEVDELASKTLQEYFDKED
jgi:ribonuclease HI